MSTSNKPGTNSAAVNAASKTAAEAKSAAAEPTKKNMPRSKDAQVVETAPKFISRRVWPD